MSTAPLFISSEECQQASGPFDVIAQVRQVLEWVAAGKIQWPVPRRLNIAPDKWGNDYHMKAAVRGRRIRLRAAPSSSHPLDESDPQSTRLILLIDPNTTLPLALVDETWGYAQRTVASIVVGVHAVANPGAKVLAIVGAGRMARNCVTYYASLFDIKEIRIASRTASRRDALVADLTDSYPEITVSASASAEHAVRGAELVLTATSADHAVIEDEWVSAGAVVAAVGTAESGVEYAKNADLFLVDSREQLRKELISYFGDEAPDWVTATVGDVLLRRSPRSDGPGPTGPDNHRGHGEPGHRARPPGKPAARRALIRSIPLNREPHRR